MQFNFGALLTKIAGGALAGFAPILGALFPKQQLLWTAIFGTGGLLVLIAGMFVQSQMPAAKVVADAPVVDGQTGKQVATNVSSTSNLLSSKGL